MSKKEIIPEGKIEFDVLVDGKYQRRVSEGIIIEGKSYGCEVGISCKNSTLFAGLFALEEFVKDHNLQDDYDRYKKLRNTDFNNIDEAMGMLDELLEKLKQK